MIPLSEDCPHTNIKCVKCHRTGVTETALTIPKFERIAGEYYPATISRVPDEESIERFYITKGPVIVEIEFNTEEVCITICDGSAPDDEDGVDFLSHFYSDFLDHKHSNFIWNPKQHAVPFLKLKDILGPSMEKQIAAAHDLEADSGRHKNNIVLGEQ